MGLFWKLSSLRREEKKEIYCECIVEICRSGHQVRSGLVLLCCYLMCVWQLYFYFFGFWLQYKFLNHCFIPHVEAKNQLVKTPKTHPSSDLSITFLCCLVEDWQGLWLGYVWHATPFSLRDLCCTLYVNVGCYV